MFNYSLRTKIYLSVLLAVGIAAVFVFASINKSRADDIGAMSQAQILGMALEKYYDKFNAYPNSPRINTDSINVISENGLNQPGDIAYYNRNFVWLRPATYSSNGETYVIEFKVANSWPAWGAKRGSLCRLQSNLKLSCQEK